MTATVARLARLLLALLALAAPAHAAAQAPEALRGVRRVLFLGNSITYAGDYVADVESWLLARGMDVEVLDLGLPSETGAELTPAEQADHLGRHGFGRPALGERLERVLDATRPDLVFACYGMNDGSALPPGEEGVRRFAAAMERLRETAARHGVREVIFLTPPVFDAAMSTAADYDPALARFSAWLTARRADGWRVIDLHTPMRRELDERRRREPGFALARDGVHPGREGHWLMAREIVAFFGDTAAAALPSSEALLARAGADPEVRARVYERMALLRDAWLTHTGHTRPQMKPGLPLDEARARAEELTRRIRAGLPRATRQAVGVSAGAPAS